MEPSDAFPPQDLPAIEQKMLPLEADQPGMTMTDLLTLPDLERQLLSWILRVGSVSFAEIVDYTGHSAVAVETILGTLMAQGYLRSFDWDSTVRYQPCITSKRVHRSTGNLWRALDSLKLDSLTEDSLTENSLTENSLTENSLTEDTSR